MSILIGILTTAHVLVALFLIFLVLMQKSKDQGIGTTFGGGVTESVFGGGATTALVRMTIYCACFLLATTLVLAILHARKTASTGLMQKVIEQSGDAAPVVPPADQGITITPVEDDSVQPSEKEVPSEPTGQLQLEVPAEPGLNLDGTAQPIEVEEPTLPVEQAP